MTDAANTRSTAWMTRRYVLALTVIAVLASLAYGSFEMVIAEEATSGAVVNISGRQRMLSQRTAFFVRTMLDAEDAAEYGLAAAKLRQAANLLELSHKGLIEGSDVLGLPSGMSETVRAMYFEGPESLDGMMRDYIAALRAIQKAPREALHSNWPEVRHVLAVAPGPLLDALDMMVWQYQREGEETVLRLRRLEATVLGLTLLALTLEVLLIFRPMVGHVRDQIAHISEISDELRAARDTLEEQVRQRTSELHEAKEAAERANHAKSRFLAAASHDLLQPLEAIGMFTGMLERQVEGERPKGIFRDLKVAQRSMRRLLDSLLEISKLEAGVVVARPRPMALEPLLAQMGGEFLPQALHRGLTLRVVTSGATVLSDPAMLERILRNLMSNAIRYTRQGGILLGCRREGGRLRIEVHDTGPGIAEADRRRIFEEFSQLDDPHRDRSEGIGLGLAICDRLARLLDHPLGMRSRMGRGSVFSVALPVVEET
ncbi:MAG: ATP-binding protein [Magnetospirillum sp. WYHS-4]